MLEAVGIGAILPLISLMGQPDFLSDHQVVAGYASLAGITTTQGFIMSAAADLLKLLFGQQFCVENLCFCYPASQKEVLQEVSFTVSKGAFLGVVGSSGARYRGYSTGTFTADRWPYHSRWS